MTVRELKMALEGVPEKKEVFVLHTYDSLDEADKAKECFEVSHLSHSQNFNGFYLMLED